MAFRTNPSLESDTVSRKPLHMQHGANAANNYPQLRAGDGDGIGLITMQSAFSSMPEVASMQPMLSKARIIFGMD